MTKVEKMARAMREAYAGLTGETPLVPFDQSRAKHDWQVCASAALQAMMEPTEAMREFAEDNFDRDGDPIAVVWRAMITKALSEAEEVGK